MINSYYWLILLLILIVVIAILMKFGISPASAMIGGYNNFKYVDKALEKRQGDDLFDEDYKIYSEQRGKHYVPISSNKQIGKIINNAPAQKYYALATRIAMTISKRLTSAGAKRWDARKEAYDITHRLLKNYTTDENLYREVAKIGKDNELNDDDESSRSEIYADAIMKKIKGKRDKMPITASTATTDGSERRLFPKGSKVLDIGCGSCKIVEVLGKMLDMEAYGCDITNWSEYSSETRSKSINFTEVEETGPLPYKDEEFELVIMNMTLHHMSDPEERLSEASRVLKKGGILFIREHQLHDDFDAILIDIDHVIREFKADTKITDEKIVRCNGNYWASKEIDMLMENVGCSYIHAGEYLTTYNTTVQFNKVIWGMYVKN